MHTFQGESCVIHHDGSEDGSGEGVVYIDVEGTEVQVLARDLFDFVGTRMQTQLISKIEQLRGRDYLYAQNGPV